jgi:prolyl oligopeptidase
LISFTRSYAVVSYSSEPSLNMRNLLAILLLLQAPAALFAQMLPYPSTKKVTQSDDYFGVTVEDPYRWLEDDNSAETAAWVQQQNKVTESYFSTIPFRAQLKTRLTQLWNFPKMACPFKAKNNYFVYTNDGLQNQFVLNILRGGPDAKPEVFLDPNTLSKDGTVNVSSLSTSKDGKYLAYTISKAGSDWQEINVKSTANGNQFNDKIEWVKFSSIAWKGNGFYYSRFEKPDSVNLFKGSNENHRIYFHLMGNKQKYDVLVYEDKEFPRRNFYAEVTDDENYLVVTGSQGSGGNSLRIKDLNKQKSNFVPIIETFDKHYNIIDNDSSKFFMLTDAGASNYQVIMFDINHPKGKWTPVIPESENVLQSVIVGNNLLIAKYMKDAKSLIKLFTKEGVFVGEVPLETIGDVDQMSADEKDENLFYSLISFTSPSTIYRYNLRTKTQQVYFKPKLDFNSSDYETKQVFYSSKDGTKIPMFIVHKKNIVLDGNNPVLLFAYGGFNVSQPPIFKIERLVFLENGGVFALANIRGGSEYGEDWHEAGTKLKKQNVFDDFIAAGEYLIKEKYTSPSKVAISGRSNGGLLVGAVMTQRPELFKVAVPVVGVMDMLRYHKFTIGWAWKGDYGSSEDEQNFRNLYAYSPLHNIKSGVNYPATLAITGDHDDRVVPAHSFKFISTLQEKYKGPNPVLIRIDVNTGHASTTALGSSKPVAKQIEEQGDIFSFILHNLGMKLQ